MDKTLLINICGWVGNILFVVGAYGLTKKKIYGFQCQFIANSLYAVQSYIMMNTSLFFLSIGLALFNCYGIWEWSKNVLQRNNS